MSPLPVGADATKFPDARRLGPSGTLAEARSLGLDGLFFRSLLEISGSLDRGELREVASEARAHGMYLEGGLGKVNPFATPESPELRAIGDGDIRRGFVLMMEAAADIDCRELWVSTANKKPQYPGRFAYDRFRTDVEWGEQLRATIRFLRELAPVARALGLHLNLETHEEITSWEALRVVDEVGPEVMGIVFDTTNMRQRGEEPVSACRRVAAHVRQTHVKDATLRQVADGVRYDVVPCGQGVVDLRAIVAILVQADPAPTLTLENRPPQPAVPEAVLPTLIELDAPEWRAAHPDLDLDELARVRELAVRPDSRAAAAPDGGGTFGIKEAREAIRASAAYVRGLLAELERVPATETSDGGAERRAAVAEGRGR
jgi:sugar phosphate isomerase/epimerase